MFPLSHLIHIVYDGARPHLRGMVPEEYVDQFRVHLLPPYTPFFNPTEQAHSCFKAHVKQQLASPVIQAEIMDAPHLRAQQQCISRKLNGEQEYWSESVMRPFMR